MWDWICIVFWGLVALFFVGSVVAFVFLTLRLLWKWGS